MIIWRKGRFHENADILTASALLRVLPHCITERRILPVAPFRMPLHGQQKAFRLRHADGLGGSWVTSGNQALDKARDRDCGQ